MIVLNSFKKKKLLQQIVLAEIAYSALEVSCRGAYLIINSIYRDKMNPYLCGTILIVTQFAILTLIIRGTHLNWKNNSNIEQQLKQHTGTKEEKAQTQHISSQQYVILGILVFQLLCIVISTITPLLYQYKHIGLQTSIILGSLGFICGVVPQSIFTATTIAYSRLNMATSPPHEQQQQP